MGNRRSELDMTEPFPSYLRLNHLNTAFFTNHPTVFHPFIFSAVTFVVLHRAENFGTEKSVTFRLECAIIYRLRFFYLSMGPVHDLFR